MTKLVINLKGNSAYVDCLKHSDNHDVCTIVSSLMNVLVTECIREGVRPKIYEPGHVLIDAEFDSDRPLEVFKAVSETFKQVEAQHKEYLKIY